MSTPAQDRGIVLGKQYTVVTINGEDHASTRIVPGDLVELTWDDNSDVPAFNKIDADGTVTVNRFFMDLREVVLREVVTAPAPASATTYISVRTDEKENATMFIVGRILTPAERAAVFNLLNSQGA